MINGKIEVGREVYIYRPFSALEHQRNFTDMEPLIAEAEENLRYTLADKAKEHGFTYSEPRFHRAIRRTVYEGVIITATITGFSPRRS